MRQQGRKCEIGSEVQLIVAGVTNFTGGYNTYSYWSTWIGYTRKLRCVRVCENTHENAEDPSVRACGFGGRLLAFQERGCQVREASADMAAQRAILRGDDGTCV